MKGKLRLSLYFFSLSLSCSHLIGFASVLGKRDAAPPGGQRVELGEPCGPATACSSALLLSLSPFSSPSFPPLDEVPPFSALATQKKQFVCLDETLKKQKNTPQKNYTVYRRRRHLHNSAIRCACVHTHTHTHRLQAHAARHINLAFFFFRASQPDGISRES